MPGIPFFYTMNVLLHMCCGPCAVAVIERLLDEGHKVTGFFFNPNIHPLSEYMRRREAAGQAAKHYSIPLVFGDALPYEEQEWAMTGLSPLEEPLERGPHEEADQSNNDLENLPPAVNPVLWLRMIHGREYARCLLCWASRLRQTARHAARHGFDAITSSLLYSRYQDHALLKKQGASFAKAHGLAFVYADYRELWQYGIDRSKELDLYRQPYCGCMLSEYERYAKKLQRMIKK